MDAPNYASRSEEGKLQLCSAGFQHESGTIFQSAASNAPVKLNFLKRGLESPRNPQAGKPALRGADILVCGFWRLSSRQFNTELESSATRRLESLRYISLVRAKAAWRSASRRSPK